MNYILTLIHDSILLNKNQVIVCVNVESKEALEANLKVLKVKYTIEDATDENLSKLAASLPEHIKTIDFTGKFVDSQEERRREEESINADMANMAKMSYHPNSMIDPAPSKFIPGNNPKPYSHKRK